MSVDVVGSAPDLLRVLGEPRRWQIVELLAAEELCVCHLAEEMGIPQPLVSHHLKVLRDGGVVESERYRFWTYYRLRPGAIEALRDRLEAIVARRPDPGQRRRPCE